MLYITNLFRYLFYVHILFFITTLSVVVVLSSTQTQKYDVCIFSYVRDGGGLWGIGGCALFDLVVWLTLGRGLLDGERFVLEGDRDLLCVGRRAIVSVLLYYYVFEND